MCSVEFLDHLGVLTDWSFQIDLTRLECLIWFFDLWDLTFEFFSEISNHSVCETKEPSLTIVFSSFRQNKKTMSRPLEKCSSCCSDQDELNLSPEYQVGHADLNFSSVVSTLLNLIPGYLFQLQFSSEFCSTLETPLPPISVQSWLSFIHKYYCNLNLVDFQLFFL